MTSPDFIQIIMFLALLVGLTPVLGSYMNKVFTGSKHFMLPVFGWLERLTYRSAGVDPNAETNWKTYTFGLLVLNLAGIVFLFLIQLFQGYFPINPAHLQAVSWHSALNTA
jgi:K+-transporting ATPase ATPase A chain